ncbi:nucleotidyltransferase domain-containing protein [Lysinibacillus halotolerans]|uniref:Nucleotidyltransferase domain-containing protein n=2 Tax=Bacillales TaxID=1385 RepID=A0A3M8H5S1_9BACI|nr:nucleotidyltransferase domain-containing protein [Lysinibacillus halotolerans]RNC97554.1 nucleotidyltransferase domain-containing protein [Lysinibacillus halotolerans]
MKEVILKKLMELEEKYSIKILYAVESGSRAWGFAAENSDYDVRFIYVHHPNWYLSIDPQGVGSKKDSMEFPINDYLDINGWEITKALRLFRKSNPTILEWLKSEIIYYQNDFFVEQLRLMQSDVFSSTASLHHYLNVANNNYKTYLQRSTVKVKIYLYAIKSLLACRWIEKFQTVPPIAILELLPMMDNKKAKWEVEQLLNRRNSEVGIELIEPIPVLNHYIKDECMRIKSYIQTVTEEQKNSTEKLDHLFRQTLKKVWTLNES